MCVGVWRRSTVVIGTYRGLVTTIEMLKNIVIKGSNVSSSF